MTTIYANDYCREPAENINGYLQAVKDTTQTWVVFHRNHLTPYGWVKTCQLKLLGLWYNRPASELIFMRRADAERIEAAMDFKDRPITTQSFTHVIRAYRELHPDRPLLLGLDKSTVVEMSASIRRLRVIHAQILQRCYNEDSQDYRWYGAKGVGVCPEWREGSWNFVMWALRQGYKHRTDVPKGDRLSIDRLDSGKDYCPENCRWIAHRENSRRVKLKTELVRQGLVASWARTNQIVKEFPDARNRLGRVDWNVVLNNHMEGDKARLRKYLRDKKFTASSISRIVTSTEVSHA